MRHHGKRLLDIDPLAPHVTDHFLDQDGVIQQQQLRVENGGVFGPHRLAHPRLDVVKLLAALEQRMLEPPSLLRDVFLANGVPRHRGRGRAANHKQLATANTARDRNPAESSLACLRGVACFRGVRHDLPITVSQPIENQNLASGGLLISYEDTQQAPLTPPLSHPRERVPAGRVTVRV